MGKSVDRMERKEIKGFLDNLRAGKFEPHFVHADDGGKPTYILISEESPGYWLGGSTTMRGFAKFCKSEGIAVGKIVCTIRDCPIHKKGK